MRYETRDGDMMDEIAFRLYGSASAEAVQQIMAANPGIADTGPELPAGMVLEIPELAAPAAQQGVRLWD